MKKYIKQLIKLINYERDAEIELMTNEIKNLSPKKRESLGRAINKVKGKYLGKQLGSQIVQFGRSEKIETEISVGDMVLISTGYPLRSDLTGTVVEKGARFIKVAFEKSTEDNSMYAKASEKLTPSIENRVFKHLKEGK